MRDKQVVGGWREGIVRGRDSLGKSTSTLRNKPLALTVCPRNTHTTVYPKPLIIVRGQKILLQVALTSDISSGLGMGNWGGAQSWGSSSPPGRRGGAGGDLCPAPSSSAACTEPHGPSQDELQRFGTGCAVPGIPMAHVCVFIGVEETPRLIIFKPR